VRQKSTNRVYGRIVAWNERRDREHIITFVTGCVLDRDRKKLARLFDILFSIEDLPRFPELLATHGMSPLRGGTPRASAPASAGSEAPPEGDTVLSGAEDEQRSTFFTEGKKCVPSLHSVTLGDVPLGDRTDYWKIAPQTFSAHQAWIPIQNGCNRFCAYCAVPYTRGREVSRAADEILDEIARLLEQGYRSFTLLGQNVNSYGRDWEPDADVHAATRTRRAQGETRSSQSAQGERAWAGEDAPSEQTAFVRLLDDASSLIEKSGLEALVYFTSPHPVDMRREVFELMAARPSIARQVHLPMQSGDDDVLRRMHRSYTAARYREIIGWVRELVPDATLFTDIIVGFPGETEDEFERTRQAMLEFNFDMAFVAAYSPRQGTAGAKMRDDVPMKEKSRRLNILGDLLKEMGAAKKARLVGSTMRLLVDGVARAPHRAPQLSTILSARTNGLLPVHVSLPEGAALPAADELVGQFINARITGASALSLAAEYMGP